MRLKLSRKKRAGGRAYAQREKTRARQRQALSLPRSASKSTSYFTLSARRVQLRSLLRVPARRILNPTTMCEGPFEDFGDSMRAHDAYARGSNLLRIVTSALAYVPASFISAYVPELLRRCYSLVCSVPPWVAEDRTSEWLHRLTRHIS